MKLTKLFVCGTLLTVVTGAQASYVHAVEYEDALNAQSTGEITFEDADATIVDPNDPEKEVIPGGESNASKGDLVLQYVSDFNFGKHKKTLNEFSTQALPDTVVAANDDTNSSYNVPLFVSTKDMRTDRGNGWTLTVTASSFSSISDQKELKGGEVVLTNSFYKDVSGIPQINSKAISNSLDTGLALTPGQEVVIANADASKDQGLGSYSLSMGSLVDDNGEEKVSGATFRMPAKTVVDSEKYQATFDWELKPELSSFE